VADLLECVIQIKALEDSIVRLERLVGAPAVSNDPRVEALLVRLIDAEHRYAILRLMTPASKALLGERFCEDHVAGDRSRSDSPVDEFTALRRANLGALQACTAADLASRVEWPGCRHTTVADLVAIMLAHDTEVLGELSRHRAGDRA
jgi:hypothetical protein